MSNPTQAYRFIKLTGGLHAPFFSSHGVALKLVMLPRQRRKLTP
jgi:hypothetical protein